MEFKDDVKGNYLGFCVDQILFWLKVGGCGNDCYFFQWELELEGESKEKIDVGCNCCMFHNAKKSNLWLHTWLGSQSFRIPMIT